MRELSEDEKAWCEDIRDIPVTTESMRITAAMREGIVIGRSEAAKECAELIIEMRGASKTHSMHQHYPLALGDAVFAIRDRFES